MKKFLLITIILISIGFAVLITKNLILDDSIKKVDNLDTSNKDINAYELSQMLNNKDFLLIDVHIPEQRHIPETDFVIPYNQIDKVVNTIGQDKNKKVVIYCRSGSMSRGVVKYLRDIGYKNVYELTGGINSWIQKALKL